MNIDYNRIQHSINEYGKYILSCIKNEFGNSLTSQQMQNINYLLNTEFIIIERPSSADIKFFSKQDGIENPADYSIEYVPSAHEGELKMIIKFIYILIPNLLVTVKQMMR